MVALWNGADRADAAAGDAGAEAASSDAARHRPVPLLLVERLERNWALSAALILLGIVIASAM